jgi:transposase
MSYKLNITKEKIDELRAFQKKTSHIKIFKRIQCILMISKGYSKSEIADIIDVSNNTVTTWLKIYTKGGLELLSTFDYKDRKKSKLSDIKENIRNYIETEVPSKVSQVQDWIRKNYNIEIEHSWLYRYLKKNSIYLIKKQD